MTPKPVSARHIAHTFAAQCLLACLIVFWSVHSLCAQSPSPATSPKDERAALMMKAIEAADKYPNQLGLLKLTKYVAFAVDRNDPEDVLTDSDIKIFIPPIMLSSDLIMVLYIPEDREKGPLLAVYIDKKIDGIKRLSDWTEKTREVNKHSGQRGSNQREVSFTLLCPFPDFARTADMPAKTDSCHGP